MHYGLAVLVGITQVLREIWAMLDREMEVCMWVVPNAYRWQ